METHLLMVYLMAGLAGFSAITLVMLAVRGKKGEKPATLYYMTGFTLSNFLLGILYMFESFRYCMEGSFEYGVFNRGFDISLFVCQGYMWIMFINFYIKDRTPLCRGLKKYALPVYTLTLIISVIAYTWCFDENFYATGTTGYVLQLIIAVIMSGYTILCTAEMLYDAVTHLLRTYVTAVTVMLVVNGWWNAAIVLRTIKGVAVISDNFDITSFLLFVIGVCNTVYIYKADFSPIFYADKPEASDREETPQERIDRIAALHMLTQRERDVLALAYAGKTNPEIAEELYISKYTVKRHMHSIFEKLDVSTRIELVHLVGGQNGPGGS